MDEYGEFLQSKRIVAPPTGKSVNQIDINPVLYDFQRDITQWALGHGRAAVFADCGLGKSLIQLEYARHVGGTVLIVAPLAVSDQTIRIASELLNLAVLRVDGASDLRPGINITNYEMLKHFEDTKVDGLILDESSILKSIDGKTRGWLLSHFRDVPFRLCCTATPCPNDVAELANHAEFLGVMKRQEMLASFFVHDEDGWRLRGHAKQPFYRWLASWAIALRSPEDLGYDGSQFRLPSLDVIEDVVITDWRREGELFPGQLKGITDRIAVRKSSVNDRVNRAVEIIRNTDGQAVVWCGLNDESNMLARMIPDSVEISGADGRESKREKLLQFINGGVRVLVTKAKVAGFGLNLQNASTMVFVGLGDSYELYYQCIRRCWRYGQQHPVECYVVVTDHERQIVANVQRKEAEASILMRDLVSAAKEYEMGELHRSTEHTEDFTRRVWTGDMWELRLGDCVDEVQTLAENSIDLSVFSPPFSSLYTYSATERDIGNTRDDDEFFAHFGFVIDGLLRATKPGRVCAVHVADVPAMLVRDRYIGLKDFSGEVIRAFIARGWIFDARVPIDKNQQAQSIRTHAKGLTMTQMEKDRTWSRPALPDYILKFRKPGENAVPVKDGDITRDLWIEYANPTWPGTNGDRAADAGAFATWYGISESDTLNIAEGRGADDDRHICALQLGTIERIIRLWSNKGELVCSPFAGIGSEGYEAVRLGRRFWGAELKPRYAEVAVKNLNRVTTVVTEPTLFDTPRVA